MMVLPVRHHGILLFLLLLLSYFPQIQSVASTVNVAAWVPVVQMSSEGRNAVVDHSSVLVDEELIVLRRNCMYVMNSTLKIKQEAQFSHDLYFYNNDKFNLYLAVCEKRVRCQRLCKCLDIPSTTGCQMVLSSGSALSPHRNSGFVVKDITKQLERQSLTSVSPMIAGESTSHSQSGVLLGPPEMCRRVPIDALLGAALHGELQKHHQCYENVELCSGPSGTVNVCVPTPLTLAGRHALVSALTAHSASDKTLSSVHTSATALAAYYLSTEDGIAALFAAGGDLRLTVVEVDTDYVCASVVTVTSPLDASAPSLQDPHKSVALNGSTSENNADGPAVPSVRSAAILLEAYCGSCAYNTADNDILVVIAWLAAVVSYSGRRSVCDVQLGRDAWNGLSAHQRADCMAAVAAYHRRNTDGIEAVARDGSWLSPLSSPTHRSHHSESPTPREAATATAACTGASFYLSPTRPARSKQDSYKRCRPLTANPSFRLDGALLSPSAPADGSYGTSGGGGSHSLFFPPSPSASDPLTTLHSRLKHACAAVLASVAVTDTVSLAALRAVTSQCGAEAVRVELPPFPVHSSSSSSGRDGLWVFDKAETPILLSVGTKGDGDGASDSASDSDSDSDANNHGGGERHNDSSGSESNSGSNGVYAYVPSPSAVAVAYQVFHSGAHGPELSLEAAVRRCIQGAHAKLQSAPAERTAQSESTLHSGQVVLLLWEGVLHKSADEVSRSGLGAAVDAAIRAEMARSCGGSELPSTVQRLPEDAVKLGAEWLANRSIRSKALSTAVNFSSDLPSVRVYESSAIASSNPIGLTVVRRPPLGGADSPNRLSAVHPDEIVWVLGASRRYAADWMVEIADTAAGDGTCTSRFTISAVTPSGAIREGLSSLSVAPPEPVSSTEGGAAATHQQYDVVVVTAPMRMGGAPLRVPLEEMTILGLYALPASVVHQQLQPAVLSISLSDAGGVLRLQWQSDAQTQAMLRARRAADREHCRAVATVVEKSKRKREKRAARGSRQQQSGGPEAQEEAAFRRALHGQLMALWRVFLAVLYFALLISLTVGSAGRQHVFSSVLTLQSGGGGGGTGGSSSAAVYLRQFGPKQHGTGVGAEESTCKVSSGTDQISAALIEKEVTGRKTTFFDAIRKLLLTFWKGGGSMEKKMDELIRSNMFDL